jgi:hypothetical protein
VRDRRGQLNGSGPASGWRRGLHILWAGLSPATSALGSPYVLRWHGGVLRRRSVR